MLAKVKEMRADLDQCGGYEITVKKLPMGDYTWSQGELLVNLMIERKTISDLKARSYKGELWTWGKGLRGQLGQGKAKFSVVPRKVDTFTSFLKIDSGFGHSTCLSTSKKIFREVVAESTNEGKGHKGIGCIETVARRCEHVDC